MTRIREEEDGAELYEQLLQVDQLDRSYWSSTISSKRLCNLNPTMLLFSGQTTLVEVHLTVEHISFSLQQCVSTALHAACWMCSFLQFFLQTSCF